MKIEGGCLCGDLRYSITSEPDRLGDCHCVDCRRSSGAAFVTWGSIPRNDLKTTKGTLRCVAYAGRIRSFAECCGTQILFEEAAGDPVVDFTVSSLDDPSPYPPAKAIWVEDKLPWVVLDPTLPSHWNGSEEAD